MAAKRDALDPRQRPLFDVQVSKKRLAVPVAGSQHPLWTENKAKLIASYLKYFVYVAKHGTYIDGFAGPQRMKVPGSWAAKLALQNEPKWFRHFHLFEIRSALVKRLEALKAEQPHDPKRTIDVYAGDFNKRVHELLASGSISAKEATFCLLDQRTSECHWATVQALAAYKPEGAKKIELFYFLASHWLPRAIAGTTRHPETLDRWWGSNGWKKLKGLDPTHRCELMQSRFIDELGYIYVTSWPIHDRRHRGHVMFYMIHASDHAAAPGLMQRAYNNVVAHREPTAQQLEFMTRDLGWS